MKRNVKNLVLVSLALLAGFYILLFFLCLDGLDMRQLVIGSLWYLVCLGYLSILGLANGVFSF